MRHAFIAAVLRGLLCAMIVVGCASPGPPFSTEDGKVFHFNMDRREELIKIDDGAAGSTQSESIVKINYTITKDINGYLVTGSAAIPYIPARGYLYFTLHAAVGDEESARIESVREDFISRNREKPSEIKFGFRCSEKDAYLFFLPRLNAQWEG